MTPAETDILVVDDNEGDRLLLRIALEKGSLLDRVRLHEAADGDEALAFLRRAPRPRLVLLDLNMPGKDGMHVLREMRADERLRGIPVVVLTTSDSEQEAARARALGAAGWVRKPIEVAEYRRVLTDLVGAWIERRPAEPA